MDYSWHKHALEQEKAKLEEELSHLGTPTGKKGDWDATLSDPTTTAAPEESAPEADPLDAAQNIEHFEERFSTQDSLEKRYGEVTTALKALSEGSYGTCHEGEAHEIEEGRLKANPAALTCTAHTK